MLTLFGAASVLVVLVSFLFLGRKPLTGSVRWAQTPERNDEAGRLLMRRRFRLPMFREPRSRPGFSGG